MSMPYLEHLLTPLLKTGLIRSTRGSRGGISLAKSLKDIKLIDMYQILEGTTAPDECVNNPQECPRSDFCVTRDIWGEITDAINGVLESTTLQDLVERHEQKQQTAEAMYHI
ncbi:RrF2 family transcriptional regulator [Chloroflexota bacterium]